MTLLCVSYDGERRHSVMFLAASFTCELTGKQKFGLQRVTRRCNYTVWPPASKPGAVPAQLFVMFGAKLTV